MSRVTDVRYEFVDSAPEKLQPATLYVSVKYRAIVHLCLCGCNEKVLLNLDPSPDCWSFTFDGKSISIHDSVGNVGLPCRSHYIVNRNRVLWLRQLSTVDPVAALGERESFVVVEEIGRSWLPKWWMPWRRKRS
jgi:hypothetical protein